MEMLEISKYVVPIHDAVADCGVGFFVGDIFITAAHVIADDDRCIFLNHTRIPLLPRDAIMTSTSDKKGLRTDYIMFRINGINSPLSLSRTKPMVGDWLKCVSFSHEMTYDTPEERLPHIVCDAEVVSHYENYFSCNMDRVLFAGTSGSPILKKGEVIGLLCGGYINNPYQIVFQSASIIPV